MAVIDLYACSSVPSLMIEASRLVNLEDTALNLSQQHKWTDRDAEILDDIYRYRLIQALRCGTLAENRELLQHLNKVAQASFETQLNALKTPYHTRWRSYVALLEDRVAFLERSPAPVMLLKCAAYRDVLQFVIANQPVTERAIIERFAGQANVFVASHVIGMMLNLEILDRRAGSIIAGLNGVLPNAESEIPENPTFAVESRTQDSD
jgi:hypothetical protein